MFRVSHAGRRDPTIELAAFISHKPFFFPSGLVNTGTSSAHFFPVRGLRRTPNLSVLLHRDEYASPNINGPVGSIGQYVRH